MHRYDFIRMRARKSRCPALLQDALMAAHQSLKYCSSKDNIALQTRTQRVVGCEIALLKSQALSEKNSALMDAKRSPSVKVSILLHAAAAYRFYYRNNIGGGAPEVMDIGKRILDWCKHNHSHALKLVTKCISLPSLSTSAIILELMCEIERVQFLRERVASQGAPTDSCNSSNGKNLFDKSLKNRKRIHKQVDVAVKAARNVEDHL